MFVAYFLVCTSTFLKSLFLLPSLTCLQDYVYVAYFLICTSTFLKIRWWVGTLVLLAPMVLAEFWHFDNVRKVSFACVCVGGEVLLLASSSSMNMGERS